MTRRLWLIRLFPRRWRDRYGDEFLALLEAEGLTLAGAADILKTAAFEWACHLRRHAMPAGPKGLNAVPTPPSALLPVVMSLTALLIVLADIAITGGKPQTDEGAAAHIFQILIVAQVPVIGYFLVRWIRRRPWFCVLALVVQGLALASALLPVWYFRL